MDCNRKLTARSWVLRAGRKMKRIIVLGIFVFAIADACFAQSNQTRSLTVTTFYPAPYAVYRSLRLSSINEEPTGSALNGTIYFNSTDQKPYYYNGTSWNSFGGSKPLTYNIASPSKCTGTLSNDTRNKEQLCSTPWQELVNFTPGRFATPPHVMVVPVQIPYDVNSSCANNSTERYISYPKNITKDNFTMVAAGGVPEYTSGNGLRCENTSAGEKYFQYFTRALVYWFAVTNDSQ